MLQVYLERVRASCQKHLLGRVQRKRWKSNRNGLIKKRSNEWKIIIILNKF